MLPGVRGNTIPVANFIDKTKGGAGIAALPDFLSDRSADTLCCRSW